MRHRWRMTTLDFKMLTRFCIHNQATAGVPDCVVIILAAGDNDIIIRESSLHFGLALKL